MAVLPVSNHGEIGLGVTLQAAAPAGDTIPVIDGWTLLRIRNTSGANAYTVTIAGRTCNQGFTHPLAMAVPAGANITYNSPLLHPDRFDSGAIVTYTGTAPATDLTLGVVRMDNTQGIA